MAEMTPYAKRVCSMIANGMTTPEIAERLDKSQSAIYVYVSRTMKSLGVNNRKELVEVHLKQSGIPKTLHLQPKVSSSA